MSVPPLVEHVRRSRRAAIARVVVGSLRASAAAGSPEPGLGRLPVLLSHPVTWRDDGLLGFAAILAVHCRVMFGPLWEDADAAQGLIRFGHMHRSTGARHGVDAQEVPLVPRTWGQAFGATIAKDYRLVGDLWLAAVGADHVADRAEEDRAVALELLETAFATAVPAVAAVRCTCGECLRG